MIKKYKKKPVIVEAVQWTGDNKNEIKDFVGGNAEYQFDGILYIYTLEYKHLANIGDYIIKGIDGEFYPCNPDVFKQTYEEVKE